MQRFLMSKLFDILDITPPDLLLRDYGRRAYAILERELIDMPSGWPDCNTCRGWLAHPRIVLYAARW